MLYLRRQLDGDTGVSRGGGCPDLHGAERQLALGQVQPGLGVQYEQCLVLHSD